MPFWVKTVLLGQEVHYYMVYIAYFTELNLQICDFALKRRICHICKYALDENFHGHFCARRKAAKFCHPAHTCKSYSICTYSFITCRLFDEAYIFQGRLLVPNSCSKYRDGPATQALSPHSLWDWDGDGCHFKWVEEEEKNKVDSPLNFSKAPFKTILAISSSFFSGGWESSRTEWAKYCGK